MLREPVCRCGHSKEYHIHVTGETFCQTCGPDGCTLYQEKPVEEMLFVVGEPVPQKLFGRWTIAWTASIYASTAPTYAMRDVTARTRARVKEKAYAEADRMYEYANNKPTHFIR